MVNSVRARFPLGVCLVVMASCGKSGGGSESGVSAGSGGVGGTTSAQGGASAGRGSAVSGASAAAGEADAGHGNDAGSAGENDGHAAGSDAGGVSAGGSGDVAGASAAAGSNATAGSGGSGGVAGSAGVGGNAGGGGAAVIAWGQPCTAGSTCAAPSGEVGTCALEYGHPVCVHSCAAGAYAACEGTDGLCAPNGASTACLPRCGHGVNCAADSSCSFSGEQSYTDVNNHSYVEPIGVCRPDCGIGDEACSAAGRVCDSVRGTCVDPSCPGGCLSGATCVSGVCTPSVVKAEYTSCTPSASVANGCASNLCFATGNSAGVCSNVCNSNNGDTTCGSGGVCWGDNFALAPGVVSALSGNLSQFAVFGGRNEGICAKKCNTTADCPAGANCAEWNGIRGCLLTPPPASPTLPGGGAGTPGQLCRSNNQCASGSCLFFAGFLDGECAKADVAVCPPGTVSLAIGSNVCSLTCSPNLDLQCNGSQVCDDLFSTPAQCIFGSLCRGDLDCSNGYLCDPQSGRCRTSSPTGAAIGAACTGNATCASGLCEPSAQGYPNGYCTSLCRIFADSSDTCPTGAICTNVSGTGIGATGLCFDLCDTAQPVKFDSCRPGYTCNPFTADSRFGSCQPS